MSTCRWWSVPRSPDRRRWATSALLLLAGAAQAASVIQGRVLDVATESRIAGVTLELRKGDRIMAVGASDGAGHFRLSFDVGSGPEAQTLKLLARSDHYVAASTDVVVSSGRPTEAVYDMRLLPVTVAGCLLDRPHLVIIGHFRSSTPEVPDTDLAGRIADALTYSLLLPLQELRIPSDFQPVFNACNEAAPRTKQLAGSFARAMAAEAFISGDVQPQQGQFRVSTYVGDPHGLFTPPLRTVNQGVDLDDPGAAKLNPETHAAILLALAVGYEESGHFAECVDVAVAAGRLAEDISPLLRRTIEERLTQCQARLPNIGLLRGDAP